MAGEHALFRFGIPGSADSNNRREYRRNSRACGGRKTGFRFESGQLDDLANHLLQASALNGDEYAVMQQECGDYINRRAQQSLYIRSLGELYMRCLQIPTQQRDVEEEK